MAAMAKERKRRERRKDGWRESESEKRGRGERGEERGQGREGTCRRISLRSGAGLFNERAHSTPSSSVAPAGWRPPGSGSPVGAAACSISAERRWGAEGGDLFSLTTCGATSTFAQTHAQA